MLQFFKRLFSGGMTHRASLKPFDVEVDVTGRETVLEAALRQSIAFPHSCTVGTCGSCKCRLVSGTVRARTDFAYTLSAEELKAGYVLACQAHPTSPVVIEVDGGGAALPAPERFTASVVSKSNMTADILELTLELDRPIHYVAGQFANLQFEGLPSRSYSFANPPKREGLKRVSLFIRKVPGGAVTEPLFSGALDSLNLNLEGPFGLFHLRMGEGPIICLCGGSGLAPLLSLLMDARLKNIKRPCYFFFGARTQSDLYKLDALEGIAKDWLDSFSLIPVLSHEPEGSSWTGRRGLVTKVAAQILQLSGVDLASSQAYMCGPPGMIDNAIERLVDDGMRVGDIHYDKFTDSGTGTGASASTNPLTKAA